LDIFNILLTYILSLILKRIRDKRAKYYDKIMKLRCINVNKRAKIFFTKFLVGENRIS